MKRWNPFSAKKGFVPLLGLLLLAVNAPAQEGAPTMGNDPAFERYVDLDLLGEAWDDKNAELLTDLGLQLVEGERVLLRPHKGITSEQVFAAALKVAGEHKDKAALARLGKVLTALNRNELAAQAKLAAQFADKSRAVDAALIVPVEGTSVQAFLVLQDTVEAIKSTKLGQNAKGLEAIVKEIPQMNEISEAQRRALLKMAKEAQATLPKSAKEVDPIVDVLNKLSDESRKGGHGGGHGGHGGGHAGHGGGHPGGHAAGGHPGGGHPGGGHAAGGHPGGKNPGHAGGQNSSGNRPGGNSNANNRNGGRGRGPRSFAGIQPGWQRQYSPQYNGYVYWDPTYSSYYVYDPVVRSYIQLDDGDDSGSSDSSGN